MNNEFGTIEHKGKTIILDEQAFQTSRVMNEYGSDYQYQGDGDTFMDEWAARGHTEGGDKVSVYWHFEVAHEGKEEEGAYSAETLPEDYNWNHVHSVENDD